MTDENTNERRDPQESGLPSDLPKEIGNPARRLATGGSSNVPG